MTTVHSQGSQVYNSQYNVVIPNGFLFSIRSGA